MKCFHCGTLQGGGEKCSCCGGLLEAGEREVANTARELNSCCADCGQRLVKVSCEHSRYLSEDHYFYTGWGAGQKKHSFEAGSQVRKVTYECPNRGWWRCRVRDKYLLWPDGTLTQP